MTNYEYVRQSQRTVALWLTGILAYLMLCVVLAWSGR